VLAGVSVASAAGPGNSQQTQVSTLQTQTHRALLDLYSLDTQLQTAQERLGSLEAETAQLRREQTFLTGQLGATRRTLSVSQHELATSLRLLYKQGDVNTLAVVLGSQSLDEAVTQLDALSNVADVTNQVVHSATAAQARLVRVRRSLQDRRGRLDAALAGARRSAAELASARAERVAFISQLRDRERLQTRQIAALQNTAERVQRKSNELQAAAAVDVATTTASVALPPVTAVAAAPSDARTITVTSTGYSLPGRTATGIPVGWGVVAVDPSVIPLGTKLTIPGYGEGVAADTGGAVRGDTIDLWFPTLAQAHAWGRRTVTITLH
jgi:3D (Asp-Asp-Asp) domain-containing protein